MDNRKVEDENPENDIEQLDIISRHIQHNVITDFMMEDGAKFAECLEGQVWDASVLSSLEGVNKSEIMSDEALWLESWATEKDKKNIAMLVVSLSNMTDKLTALPAPADSIFDETTKHCKEPTTTNSNPFLGNITSISLPALKGEFAALLIEQCGASLVFLKSFDRKWKIVGRRQLSIC